MLTWGEVWTSKFHTFSPITPQGLILYLGRKPLNYCSLLTMSHLHLSPLWLNKYPVIWQAQISFDLFISTCSWFGHFRVLSIFMSFFFITYSNGGFGRNQSHKFIFYFFTNLLLIFSTLSNHILWPVFWQRKKWRRCQKYKAACWTHQKAPKNMP